VRILRRKNVNEVFITLYHYLCLTFAACHMMYLLGIYHCKLIFEFLVQFKIIVEVNCGGFSNSIINFIV